MHIHKWSEWKETEPKTMGWYTEKGTPIPMTEHLVRFQERQCKRCKKVQRERID